MRKTLNGRRIAQGFAEDGYIPGLSTRVANVVQTLTDIKAMLGMRGIFPRKRFGQNFLVDGNKLRQIVEAADVGEGNVVLEVGPGTGVLTEALLEKGARVVAVEIDRDMCEILRERLAGNEWFELIEGDVMDGKHAINAEVISALEGRGEFDVPSPGLAPRSGDSATLSRGERGFTMVANLPYNVASPLMAVLASDHPRMKKAVVMVQREVGERMMAGPGNKDFGPLSVILQAMGEMERVAVLGPGCFWPQPKVESVVVKFERRGKALTDDPGKLMEMVQKLFQKRRKQVGTILGRGTALPAGIEASARPEELSVEQLVQITESTETQRRGEVEESRKSKKQENRK